MKFNPDALKIVMARRRFSSWGLVKEMRKRGIEMNVPIMMKFLRGKKVPSDRDIKEFSVIMNWPRNYFFSDVKLPKKIWVSGYIEEVFPSLR